MRFVLIILLAYNVNTVIGVSSFWKVIFGGFWSVKSNDKHVQYGFRENFTTKTGKMFATMLGFPAQCTKKGISYSCTFSLACWMAGGSSEPGCGGTSSWLISCCVISNEAVNNSFQFKRHKHAEDDSVSVIQRRQDIDIESDSCGMSADRILQKRIIGGRQAIFGEYPWQVYIKIGTYQCGGVLVSRRHVVTAGHCIASAKIKDILVYLGELDTQDTGKVEELAPAELHRVQRKILHPNFKYRPTQPDRYDIALLELLSEAGDFYHISPICLPDEDLKLTGRKAVVAGWGKVAPSNDLTGTNVLRSVTVPILDIKECMSWHRLKQINVELHREMMCAGKETGKEDACLGDSGGPLILLENGRWTLVGITSAGYGCGEAHQPGIYHRVTASVGWIRSIVVKD